MSLPTGWCNARRTILVSGLLLALAVIPQPESKAQAVLDPGQFTGRVRVGSRDILSGTFTATSTTPSGYVGTSNLNGTYWTGSALGATLDPDGFTVSVQAVDPANNNAPITYDLEAIQVATSSGINGDIDTLNFPPVHGLSLAPDEIQAVDPDFIDEHPGILRLTVTLDFPTPCPGANFYALYVTASNLDVPAAYAGSYYSEKIVVNDVQKHVIDFPVLHGYRYSLSANALVSGVDPIVVNVGPMDLLPPANPPVGPDQIIDVSATISPSCVCTDDTLTVDMGLSDLTAGDSLAGHGVVVDYPLHDSGNFTTPSYTFTGLAGGRHTLVYPYSVYTPAGQAYSANYWPWSYVSGDAQVDCQGMSVDLQTCPPADHADVDIHAAASGIEGHVSFACFGQDFTTSLIDHHKVTAYGIDLCAGGAPTGSYGGGAWTGTLPDSDFYRFILPPGTWNVSRVESALRLTPGGSASFPYDRHVDEDWVIGDTRKLANLPSDGEAVVASAGSTSPRDFEYQMGRYTATFRINAPTEEARRFHGPLLQYYGLYGSPEYTVYAYGWGEVTAPDPNGNGESGTVTLFLPKGDYGFKPYVIRAIDGSTVSFPPIYTTVGCGSDSVCDVSAPAAAWEPRPDVCVPLLYQVSGTATDADGWDSAPRIRYRLNYVSPGDPETDLGGYTNFSSVTGPGAPPDNLVTFSSDITLNPLGNVIEVERVDALGNRCYEMRTVFGEPEAGSNPTLTITSPSDGYVTDQPFVLLQGMATAVVDIASITVTSPSGVTQVSSPYTNPRSRPITDHRVALQHGWNTISVVVTDNCGHTSSTVTRNVLYNHPPACDARLAANPCGVSPARGTIELSGALSDDVDQDLPLTYEWSTDCPGGLFDNTNAAAPTLTVLEPTVCPASCTATLKVKDSFQAETPCSQTIDLSAPVAANLVGWWPGEGDGQDIALGHDGTPLSGAGFTTGAGGKVGEAFTFDGSNDHVDIPDAPELDFGPAGANGAGDFTIAAWVWRGAGASSGVQTIFDKRTIAGGQYRGYELFLYQDALGLQLAGGAAGYANYLAPASSALCPDAWHHVAVTVARQSSAVFYVDGVAVHGFSPAYASIDLGNAAGPRIGASLDGLTGAFDGLIDELQVFDRALTAGDIGSMAGAAFGQCRCTAPPSGLVSWWSADGHAADLEGSNHGLLMGGTTYTSGEVGAAFDFQNPEDYVRVEDSPTLDPESGPFSISAWVQSTGSGVFQTIASKYDCGWPACNASPSRYILRVVDSQGAKSAELELGDTAGTATIRGGVITSGFHLITGVRKPGGMMHLYVDGAEVGTAVQGPAGPITNGDNQPDPLTIGAQTQANFPELVRPFEGQIDEVQYFNRDLNQDEIRRLYDARSRGQCKPGCIAEPAGLVSWWTGDGHASDIQGANNGLMIADAAYTSGEAGGAFDFQNLGDHVRVEDSPTLDPESGPFSISAWVQSTGSGVSQTIASKYDCGWPACNASPSRYILRVVDDQGAKSAELELGDTAGTGTIRGGVITSGFHLITGVRKPGGMMHLYVDGAEVGTAVQGPAGPITNGDNQPDPFTIGAQTQSNFPEVVRPFKGQIDEVQYFSRALSPAEIRAMHDMPVCRPQGCADTDGDGYGSPASGSCEHGASHGDCDPANQAVWAAPGIVGGIAIDEDMTQTTLTWDPPVDLGGSSVVYDVIRSLDVPNFQTGGAVCLEPNDVDTQAVDGVPPEGHAFLYVVRAENGCPMGQGAIGAGSNGAVRAARSCP